MRTVLICALSSAVVAGVCGTAAADPVYDCGRTATVYDPVGYVLVTPRGQITCTVYDDSTVSLNGRLNAAAPLGSGNVTSTTYDAQDRLVSDTGSFPTTTVYDSRGDLMTVTDPAGTERYFYDNQNRLVSESGPATITNTVYDSSGRIVSLTDPQSTTSFHYDTRDRLFETDTVTGSGTLTTTFGYDALDRLITEITPTDTITFTYDALGRVVEALDVGGNPYRVDFFYDLTSGLLDQVDVNGSPIRTTYTYDANGLLTGASDPGTMSLIYTAEVPEPSSLVLLGSALLAFFPVTFSRSRRRQRHWLER